VKLYAILNPFCSLRVTLKLNAAEETEQNRTEKRVIFVRYTKGRRHMYLKISIQLSKEKKQQVPETSSLIVQSEFLRLRLQTLNI